MRERRKPAVTSLEARQKLDQLTAVMNELKELSVKVQELTDRAETSDRRHGHHARTQHETRELLGVICLGINRVLKALGEKEVTFHSHLGPGPVEGGSNA